jgi:hypothetical protein
VRKHERVTWMVAGDLRRRRTSGMFELRIGRMKRIGADQQNK